ncbi:MAG: Smr/MutS family protein [Cyclobacteriaceae bacterium]|nr:Smr/MutS family protein [Cyclobacteriaceae bacterium]
MIYPESIEQKLGFDGVRELLLSNCHSDLGKKFVLRMKPSFGFDQVRQWLTQTSELKQAIGQGLTPALNSFFDVNEELKQTEIEGAVLETEALFAIYQTLDAGFSLWLFASGLPEEEFPELRSLYSKVEFPKPLLLRLEKVFETDGTIKDSASKELKQIRQDFRIEEGRLRSIVHKAFKQAQKDGFVPDGTTISIREDRMVIPIHAGNKRHLNGFVHDESASGNIVYMEPVESLETNNKLRELKLAERREIHRILSELTQLVHDNLPQVKSSVLFLSIFDFIWAKAKLAVNLNASMPDLQKKMGIRLVNARHPQLVVAFAKDNRKVVPLSLLLDADDRLLLISGPNAGGKSVALKTIGINQYMMQCGLLPVVDPDSKMVLFKDIFIDIGDEQSIENDLSTYSSHLRNMRNMLKHAGQHSLILIDEFGTGTDPMFGGAIAEAMLEQFVENKCYGAITTHYGNLKTFAEKTNGVINGAMRFDMQHLEPEYALELGRPGSSFALELAQKSGVQGEVIRSAKEKLGAGQLDIEKLLNKLERQKQELTEREKKLKLQEVKATQLEKKYSELLDTLEGKKQDILEKARLEASNLLKDTNKKIETTIRHIKESKAEKKETKKVRQSLSTFKEKVSQPIRKEKQKTIQKVEEGDIVPGSFALLDGSTTPVEVLELKGKEAKILAGDFTSYVKLNRLQKISAKEARTTERKTQYSKKHINLVNKKAEFSSVLDVRGKRGEEVIVLLDGFLDDALMLSQTEIRVLHGKGNGILRDLVRQQLRQYNFVAHFEDEHVERGGSGITVITLA